MDKAVNALKRVGFNRTLRHCLRVHESNQTRHALERLMTALARLSPQTFSRNCPSFPATGGALRRLTARLSFLHLRSLANSPAFKPERARGGACLQKAPPRATIPEVCA